jgi:hypothetical protein
LRLARGSGLHYVLGSPGYHSAQPLLRRAQLPARHAAFRWMQRGLLISRMRCCSRITATSRAQRTAARRSLQRCTRTPCDGDHRVRPRQGSTP